MMIYLNISMLLILPAYIFSIARIAPLNNSNFLIKTIILGEEVRL